MNTHSDFLTLLFDTFFDIESTHFNLMFILHYQRLPNQLFTTNSLTRVQDSIDPHECFRVVVLWISSECSRESLRKAQQVRVCQIFEKLSCVCWICELPDQVI